MNGRVIFGVLLIVLLVLVAFGVGVYAYDAGVAQGLAQSGKLGEVPTGPTLYPYYFRPFYFRPFGFGFGLLGCLFPLLFFFLVCAMLRGIFWGGRWGWKRHHWMGMEEHGAPGMFEEWHRKAHESQTK